MRPGTPESTAPPAVADSTFGGDTSARLRTRSELEEFVRDIWAAVLDQAPERLGPDENFFSVGGDSLLIAQVMDRINTELYTGREHAAPHVTEYFAHTTIRALAERLHVGATGMDEPAVGKSASRAGAAAQSGGRIAIIGISGRFPGAPDVEALWRNLRDGVESIRTFSDAELLQAGVAAGTLRQPGYVKRGGFIEGVDRMDAEFFNLTPREAALTCPQQRLLLECAEEALEQAGYGTRHPTLRVGVFVSAGPSTYVSDHLYRGPGFFESLEGFTVASLNGSPATRISYLLDLTGPSLSIETACSSSLVDVHLACRALRGGECDMALAGGASVTAFGPKGYLCEDGGVVSPDGHCRPFDEAGRGTVFTSGAGVVLLKPLESAIRDRDTIYAVILGSAVNNDGGRKVGFTAPSLSGQAAVLSLACIDAGVDPSGLQYIETHGTGTPLGDPIEISALRRAFPELGRGSGRCALGALKGNVGHLQVAAGIAGLIKVTLALHHRELPPAVGFQNLNSAIDLDDGVLYVNERLQRWTSDRGIRRAGVSAFGIGGTNAHVILEEAPVPARAATTHPGEGRSCLLTASSRSASALGAICADLSAHLARHPEISLADVSHTLRRGRADHAFRAQCVCSDVGQAVQALKTLGESTATTQPVTRPPTVIFMFPGQGCQHPQMLRGLYRDQQVFHDHVDRGATLLLELTGTDIRSLLGMQPGADLHVEPAHRLDATELCQPMLFVLEHALAMLWISLGVRPAAMIGHSLGEYVAACVAGVLPPQDMLRLLVRRGRIMQAAAPGSMLAVLLDRGEASKLLERGCAIAAVNGPRNCVIAGPSAAIARIEATLKARGQHSTRLATSHAYHSPAMRAIAAELDEVLRSAALRAPSIPYISNVSGALITAAEATSTDYWTRHLLGTVEFAPGVETLAHGVPKVFLEVGPGCSLSSLARSTLGRGPHRVISSCRHPLSEQQDTEAFLEAVGKLWQVGAGLDWSGLTEHHPCSRVPLPTYPFQRQRHWIEPLREPRGDSEGRAATAWGGTSAIRAAGPCSGEPSRSEVESRLAELWSELLGVETVGPSDDFFELGGDSLLAAELCARSQSVLGRRISPAQLLRHRTIEHMAEFIAAGSTVSAPA